MIIIFQCYGGTHTSIVSAFIYTGRLPRKRIPTAGELKALPYFDRLTGNEMGELHFIGPDRQGNLVFSIGSGRWGKEIQKLFAACLALPSLALAPVAVVDCLSHITPETRIGGYISRYLGLTSIGRPLVCRGIRRSYRRFVQQVQRFELNPRSYLLKP